MSHDTENVRSSESVRSSEHTHDQGVSSGDYHGLSAFQRDVLVVLAGLDEPAGVDVKPPLEAYYDDGFDHQETIKRGWLYDVLNQLVELGFVEKSAKDRRTNQYELSPRGVEVLQAGERFKETMLADDPDAKELVDEIEGTWSERDPKVLALNDKGETVLADVDGTLKFLSSRVLYPVETSVDELRLHLDQNPDVVPRVERLSDHSARFERKHFEWEYTDD